MLSSVLSYLTFCDVIQVLQHGFTVIYGVKFIESILGLLQIKAKDVEIPINKIMNHEKWPLHEFPTSKE